MKLPNLSHMLRVTEFRYVQSRYESACLRNPDNLAGAMLSGRQRLACNVYGRMLLWHLRQRPFYYYLLARTQYYDEVFLSAVESGITRYVVNIGCGGDTRPYRFAAAVRENGVRVLECDQPDASKVKRELVQLRWPTDAGDFLGIDLNAESWPELRQWFLDRPVAPALVMFEGVSMYVDRNRFGLFLDFLSEILPPGSAVAYDFKISGVDDQWGATEETEPFRLPGDSRDVVAYHQAHGFSVDYFELGADLQLRLLPGLNPIETPPYREDGLVRITPTSSNR